jgi:UDP-glucose 4-epimerase
MTILVTGGTGFIGGHLARALLQLGESTVLYDRSVASGPIYHTLRPDELAELRLLQGDVTDPVHLFRTIRDVQPRVIVHLAALPTPAAQADPATAVRVITGGTVNVLEAVRQAGGPRLVWASSVQKFGPLGRYRSRHEVDRIVDDATADPVTVYGACKAQAEVLAQHYARTWDLDVTGLRPCGILAPGPYTGAPPELEAMVEAVAQGRPAFAPRADWVFPQMSIDDVVGGFLTAIQRPDRGDGRSFTIGAHNTTLRELADILRRWAPNARIECEPGGGEPAAILDNSGIREVLGFQPRRELVDGLRQRFDEALSLAGR